jgi:hypothetical protein
MIHLRREILVFMTWFRGERRAENRMEGRQRERLCF